MELNSILKVESFIVQLLPPLSAVVVKHKVRLVAQKPGIYPR
ncbi:MAG: hypothetical protein PUP90_21690 [Nostoc sp. S4]|nr:hypothetical protein [Nostoc sp. S4]